jgi:hypothetical protein
MKHAYAKQQDEALQNEDVPDYITTCFRLHLTPAAPSLQTLKTPTNNSRKSGTAGKLVWQKGQLIGKGGFGKVYKGESELGDRARKRQSKEKAREERIERERKTKRHCVQRAPTNNILTHYLPPNRLPTSHSMQLSRTTLARSSP